MDQGETNQILTDLKNIIHNLTKVTERLEKSLRVNQASDSDDNEEFYSAEEEIEDVVKPVAKQIPKKKKERKISRSKSVPYEAINETVVHNIEEEMKIEAQLQRVHAETEVNEDFFNSEDEAEAERQHVQDIKLKFELRRKNGQTIKRRSKNEDIKVNIQDLKKKFEAEDADLRAVKNETNNVKIKASTSVEETNYRTDEYDEKRKRVLKYFQPQTK